ncbi:hypothetical protein HU200_024763 [Digitaria exilis]|uniref:Uncharacterized protein n=1 Tax=Digitaria exilis TaxID=1010633 RepID=A0A835CAZ9_9POAL|nr:hypothetical protein HU200_024763 [Digitaria exilis]
MTTPLEVDLLFGREKIASFILYQVISKKGEFHCHIPASDDFL